MEIQKLFEVPPQNKPAWKDQKKCNSRVCLDHLFSNPYFKETKRQRKLVLPLSQTSVTYIFKVIKYENSSSKSSKSGFFAHGETLLAQNWSDTLNDIWQTCLACSDSDLAGCSMGVLKIRFKLLCFRPGILDEEKSQNHKSCGLIFGHW